MPKKKLQARAGTREGMVTMSVALPERLHRRLAIAGIDQHAAMNELIRIAIKEHLDRIGAKS